MLLSVEHVSKDYGMKTLLHDVSLYLNAGDRIGVIGVNGTGKSTLLRIAAGDEMPDMGAVTRDPNVQVSFLRQNPPMEDTATVLEQVFLGYPAEFRALNEYEAKTMLTKLGIVDFSQTIGALSGGQRKRVALATALLHPAEVLILDEPTNHLDTEMVAWLEERLRAFTGGLLMVTHDRYFLERVTNRIAQVERGHIYFYEANYSKYLALRQQRYDYATAAERKRQTLLKREYQWMMRGPRARGTKSRDRIERYQALKTQAAPTADQTAHMAAISSRLGKKTIALSHVSKAFSGRQVLSDFSYTLLRDDRIGIVGRNGAGKTTLLNLIAGRLAPDCGTIETGETVRLGYFSQEGRELDLTQRPYDYIHEIAASVETGEGMLTASQMLEQFLFDGDLQYAKIGSLSGGERRRLALLGVLMAAPNVLLLDEPTNDLDVETLTILEDYLATFPGAILAVSHDRYFLDKLASSIFSFGENGQVSRHTGGYSDWAGQQTASRPAETFREKRDPRPAPPQKLRFSYKEQREYASIDGEIAALEAQLSSLSKDLEAAACDYVKLQELTATQAQLEAELDEKTERWVYLSDLAERIAAQDQAGH